MRKTSRLARISCAAWIARDKRGQGRGFSSATFAVMKILAQASDAIATFNSASDAFDAPENSFRERFGLRTVAHLGLASGERVLDVCCGSGASAIPAAHAVGPSGFVLGIDLADRMLERARAKALARGLRNVGFERG